MYNVVIHQYEYVHQVKLPDDIVEVTSVMSTFIIIILEFGHQAT